MCIRRGKRSVEVEKLFGYAIGGAENAADVTTLLLVQRPVPFRAKQFRRRNDYVQPGTEVVKQGSWTWQFATRAIIVAAAIRSCVIRFHIK